MSSHFAKPENALRKAEDLVKVGKPSSALKTLHGILTARRYRQWTATHELIMMFYMSLAVDLRRNVKDALVQYRNICQQQHAGSLEKVMQHYQKLAEQKANEAQQKAAAATAAAEAASGKSADSTAVSVDDVEDLEEESPESIMLAAMSGEGTKERLDRQILTPWVKYLWECYRTILDVLRNNGRLEVLYHATARAAFDFCKRYGRNMEFRRLCEILRAHLGSIARFQSQTNAVDLNSAETQKLYLETRFQQLRMASDLELWQEAYRTIEDISENMRLGGARSEPPPELMKTYYEKLSQIFWASSNFLFHAYSLHKFYQLSAQEAQAQQADQAAVAAGQGALTGEQRTRLASAVVLSALIISGNRQAVDLHDIDASGGVEHEGNMRLAQLLGFKKELPSRQRILQAVQASGVLADANDTAKAVFRLLEHQFGPLSLYAQLKPLFEQLRADADLARYVAPLEQLTVVRVLQQLSSVFKSMKLSKFLPLVPDVGSVFALERLILSAVNSDLLSLRFDHSSMTLLFPEPDLEHARLKTQLVDMGAQLIALTHSLEQRQQTAESRAAKVKERTHVFKLIQANLLEEHENVFQRQELIEKRRVEIERLTAEKEKRAAEAAAAARLARQQEEARRLAEESARREEERRKKEAADRELRAKQALAEEMRKKLEAAASQSALGKTAVKAEKRIQALTQDLENIDKVQLMRAQEEMLRAQQREIERRRKESARKVDYLVRALRLEERELLLSRAEKTREEEREQFEADFARYLEADKAAHAKALTEQARLCARMTKEKNVFLEKLLARRQEIYAAEKAKQDERNAVRAERRRVAEEKRRKEEEARERERAKQAEEERLRREEEARREAEEAMARKKKEEERQEKLRLAKEAAEREQQAAMERMKREEEAEQRERERRAAMRGGPDAAPGAGPRAGGEPERRGWGAARGGDDRRPGGWGRPSEGPSRDMGDFRRRDDMPPRDDNMPRRDERDFRRDDRDMPRRDDRDMPRRDDRDMPRRDDRDMPRREDRPERDFADLRNRPGPAAGAEEERPRERDFGNLRNRDAPPAGGADSGARWGRGPGGFDRPRDDRPREGGFDRPREGGFDRPREGGFRDERREGGFRDDRRGGFDRAPEREREGGFRGGDRAERAPEREFSREAFGSRMRDERPAPGARGQERDWGAARSGPRADAPRRDERDFRRRDDAPAAEPAKEAAQPPAAEEDDGFTTVKKAGRR